MHESPTIRLPYMGLGKEFKELLIDLERKRSRAAHNHSNVSMKLVFLHSWMLCSSYNASTLEHYGHTHLAEKDHLWGNKPRYNQIRTKCHRIRENSFALDVKCGAAQCYSTSQGS